MTLALAFKNTTSDYSGTGAGLAGRLTSAQADNNNWLIKQAIETLQAATGKTISSCSATGNQLTITYTDATTDTITLPTASPTWRGEFAAVSYAVFDWFSYSGTIYEVKVAHTGVIPFDAGRQIGGVDVYQKILDFPAIPGKEISDSTYSTVLADANSYMRFTNVSGCTITIDPAVSYPSWAEMHFRDATGGAGIIIETATPMSINEVTGFENQSAHNGSTITVKQVGTTGDWDIMGSLLAITA